jgi:hypothetical protein
VPLGSDLSGKENSANKQNSLAVDGTGVKFPTVDAVNAGLATKISGTGTTNFIPKADAGGNLENSIVSQPVADRIDVTGSINLPTANTLVSFGGTTGSFPGIGKLSNANALIAVKADGNDFVPLGYKQGNATFGYRTGNSGIIGFTNSGGNPLQAGTVDTAISRLAANCFAFGNGTVGNTSGKIIAAKGLFNTSTDDGINQLQVNGTISHAPAVTANQGVVKSQLDLKADLASPTFTGTVTGVTAAMVGLGNVDNTSDLNKPISTATQTALNAKQNTISGTTNVVPKFGTGGVVASNITDNGSLVSTSTDMMVNGVRVGTGFNGSGNLIFGQNALLSNTTGSGNVGIGSSALQNNTTSGGNVGVGTFALLNNSSGSGNIAIGGFSGAYIADGSTPNSSSSNSIFIGGLSRAFANGQINQIAIGFDATGLGSNTTVIGNSSTLFGRWFGRLLLGTSTDNGVDALQTPSTISHAPAVTANQGVVKSQLDLKASLASPSLTGTPTAPTPTAGSANNQIATKEYVLANSQSQVTGSGTLNYVAKYTSTGLTIGNSQIYDNGTGIGIGNTSPGGYKLNITGTSYFSSVSYFAGGFTVPNDVTTTFGSGYIYYDTEFGEFILTSTNTTIVRNVDSTIVLDTVGSISVNAMDFLKLYSAGNYVKVETSAGSNIVAYSSGNTTFGPTADDTTNRVQVAGSVRINSSTSGSTAFVVNGVSGQLFSVTDSLTGDLFAVSDISGIPILTVNSEDIVKIDGDLYMNSNTSTGITATGVIQTIPYSSSTAVFFDYYVINTTSGYYRAGTIMSVCNGTTTTYTDTSTPDLGGATAGITLSVDYSTSTIRLYATITSGTWTIKSGARVL